MAIVRRKLPETTAPAIVLEGEITLVLDDSEVTLRSGDSSCSAKREHVGQGGVGAHRRSVRGRPRRDPPHGAIDGVMHGGPRD